MSATWQAVDLDFLSLLWKAWKLISVFTCCKLELFCESRRVSSNLQHLRICVLNEDKLTVPRRERIKTVSNLHLFLQGLCSSGIHRSAGNPDPIPALASLGARQLRHSSFLPFPMPQASSKKHLGKCDYSKAIAQPAGPCPVRSVWTSVPNTPHLEVSVAIMAIYF